METFHQMSNEKLLEAFIPKEAAYQLIAEHKSIYKAVMDTTEAELLSIKSLGITEFTVSSACESSFFVCKTKCAAK